MKQDAKKILGIQMVLLGIILLSLFLNLKSPEFVRGEILVGIHEHVDSQEVIAFVEQVNSKVYGDVYIEDYFGQGTYLIKIPGGLESHCIHLFESSDLVRYAELNGFARIQ
jgi:hypothetical protein